MSEIITEDLGLRAKLAAIDTTAELETVSITDRKTVFTAKTELLLEELRAASADIDLDDEEKKAKMNEITSSIQKMKNEYVNLGLAALTERKNYNIERLYTLGKFYTLIAQYCDDVKIDETDPSLPVLVSKIIEMNNYTDFKTGATIKFMPKLETKADLDAEIEFTDNTAYFMKKAKDISTRAEAYSEGVVDINEILEMITPSTIQEKNNTLNNMVTFIYKKKTFANFCKKKITDANFHKSIKKDDDYLGMLLALFMQRMEDAITVDYISDIFDINLTEGVDTKEKAIEKLQKDGVLYQIALLSSLYVMEFVQRAYASNIKSPADRFLYISVLFTKGTYANFRTSVIRAVFLTMNYTY